MTMESPLLSVLS